MTILVAYVPRPEGHAALTAGIDISRQRRERLVVVNAGPGGQHEDASLANAPDVERIEKMLREAGVDGEFKQFIRGKNAVEEIEAMIEPLQVSLLVRGLRKRSPVGKLLLGSVAPELLLTVPCPVLAVKAQ